VAILAKALKCELEVLIYQAAPHSNGGIIVALAKSVACKGLMPQPLPTNHFNMFTNLGDPVLKKLM